MLETAEVLSPAELHHIEATQRTRVAAARALDLQRSLKTHKIGGSADVFDGHRCRVTSGEQKRNTEACGNRAKTGRSDFERLRKCQRIVQLDAQVTNRALQLRMAQQ